MASMQPETKSSCLKRLTRIEGQVRGLARMVEEDRYCIDVVTQIAAARAALKRVEKRCCGIMFRPLHRACHRLGRPGTAAEQDFRAGRRARKTLTPEWLDVSCDEIARSGVAAVQPHCGAGRPGRAGADPAPASHRQRPAGHGGRPLDDHGMVAPRPGGGPGPGGPVYGSPAPRRGHGHRPSRRRHRYRHHDRPRRYRPDGRSRAFHRAGDAGAALSKGAPVPVRRLRSWDRTAGC